MHDATNCAAAARQHVANVGHTLHTEHRTKQPLLMVSNLSRKKMLQHPCCLCPGEAMWRQHVADVRHILQAQEGEETTCQLRPSE
jgi:hypothetical protein